MVDRVIVGIFSLQRGTCRKLILRLFLDIVILFAQKTAIGKTSKDATLCFGMSKDTVATQRVGPRGTFERTIPRRWQHQWSRRASRPIINWVHGVHPFFPVVDTAETAFRGTFRDSNCQ